MLYAKHVGIDGCENTRYSVLADDKNVKLVKQNVHVHNYVSSVPAVILLAVCRGSSSYVW